MTITENLQVTTPSDREIAMTRVFAAPRHLVFDALTKPELVKRWLLGPPGWSMPVCEIDLREGGAYRYVWRSDDGEKEFGTGGVFHEIRRPERFVATEKMDGFPGEGALVTQTLGEQGGRTTLTLTMRFDSKESRDGALATGMADGVAMSYDRMDEVLASLESTTLTLSTPTDREIAMMRVFDAPRHLVFEALTKPELVQRWLLGPDGWSMPVCEIDLKVGGAYRYVWRRDKDGSEMGMGGVFREVVPSERLVATEKFDQAWYPGEALTTTVLVEQGGRTTLTTTVLYESREARDGVLKSGMETGVEASYDRLAEVLASMPARG